MLLLVVRHAIAEDPADFAATGLADAERPLTEKGRRRMRRAVQGLRRLIPELDIVATSPYRRAVQTAELLHAAFRRASLERVDELVPGGPAVALDGWLERHRTRDAVAAVGHEPALSQWVSHLLAGGTRAFVELKKGGACLLDFPEATGSGRATLVWALTPRQLRAMAG